MLSLNHKKSLLLVVCCSWHLKSQNVQYNGMGLWAIIARHDTNSWAASGSPETSLHNLPLLQCDEW